MYKLRFRSCSARPKDLPCATLLAMRGPTRQPEQRLAELEQRKAQILNKIARLRNVESAKARKRDTRRKILAGSWVLAEAERDPALSQRLRKGLDTFLERDGDREVWGLMPRPKPSDASEPPAAPAEPADELAPDPNKPPLAGWTPRQLDQGWGAVLEGAQVAALPASDQLRGTPIVVTDRRGDAWTTTLTAVVSRSDTEIVVTNTGRPRR